nr:hypothetical protein [Tanacetum cinerariifolium]
MLKSFPLPVMEFPLPEYIPTASEDMFPLLKQKDSLAEEVCVADKDKEKDSYCNIVYRTPCPIKGVLRRRSWPSQAQVQKMRHAALNPDTVLFPPPAQVYSPPKKDMSWTGLPEFANDTITDYSRPSPSIESNSNDLQNSNSSIFENGESSSSILSKPVIKFVKAADCAEVKTNKVEAARKPSIKYAEMYKNTTKSLKVRGNQRNWNNLMNQRLAMSIENKKWKNQCGIMQEG